MKALVLGGGGAKGAYQAGALSVLLTEDRYDIVTGVSVGSINAAHIAQYRADDTAAGPDLVTLWRQLKPSHVYRLWYHGVLWKVPFFWQPSLYNSSPIRSFLKEHLDPRSIATSGRKLRVGAVGCRTQQYRTWTELDSHEIVDAVCASSAFPGMLEPVRIGDEYWADGGSREITPVYDAILAGATDITVVQCDPNTRIPYKGKLNGVESLKVALNAAFLEIDKWDLKVTEMYNAEVDAGIRPGKQHITMRVLKPKEVPLEDALDFDPKKIRRNLDTGKAEAE